MCAAGRNQAFRRPQRSGEFRETRQHLSALPVSCQRTMGYWRGDYHWSQLRDFRPRKWSRGNFILGNKSGIGEGSLLDLSGGVTIGDNVSLGPCCIIYTHNHEPAANGDASWKGPTRFGEVKIGEGAWIGARVTILSGVTIGARAIIGAGSVVTRDVPQDSLAVGVPARVLKKVVVGSKLQNKSSVNVAGNSL